MGQRLGDLLIERGLLTPSQLKTALRTQEFFGGHLGSILIELGFLDERTLGETLARSAGVRYAPSDLLVDIPDEVIRVVPGKVAERHKAIPIRIQDKRLHLAMLNPRDLLSLDEIAYLTGMVVVPYVAPEYRIYEALERYYHLGRLRPERITVTGKVDPKDLVHEEPPTHAQGAEARGVRPTPHGSVGLDGLPLDAEVDPGGASFAGASPQPRTEQILDQLPRSLSEWREGSGTPELPVAGPLPRSYETPRPGRRDPAPVSNRRLFEDLGMKPPLEMALLPLLIKDRVVAVLYGDNGSAPLNTLDMEQLRRQTLQAAMALEILILRTKILSV